MMSNATRRSLWLSGLAAAFCLSAMSVRAESDLAQLRNLPPADPGARSASLDAFTGIAIVDGDPFWRVDLRPRFQIGRLGIGLKAALLIGQPSGDDPDEETKTEVRTMDGDKFNTTRDYLQMISYVTWAHPRAPLYAAYGELWSVQIGHGLLMEEYTNLDNRGARLNVNRDRWGFQSVLNSFDKPELFGGRVYIRPFPGALSRLEFGATTIVDINPFPDMGVALPGQDEPPPGIEEEDPLIGFSTDVAYPLINTTGLFLELYDEAGFLSFPSPTVGENATSKFGNAVGVGLEMSPLIAKLEYRTFEEGFIPTLFGYTYEYEARTAGKGIYLNENTGSTRGVYGRAAMSLGRGAEIAALFEDYNGPSPAGDPRLGVRFLEADLIEQADISIFYLKRGIGGVDSKGEKQSFFEDLVDLDEKSLLVVEIGYNIKGPLQVLVTQEYSFRERDDEAGFEPVKKTTVQLGISTSF